MGHQSTLDFRPVRRPGSYRTITDSETTIGNASLPSLIRPMPARWPTLDDEQRTSRFLTPSMYTSVHALEKRAKTATLCHFWAGPEPLASVKSRSPSRFKISRSDVTTIRPSRPKVKWQEAPPKLPLYSAKLYTISSPRVSDEITAIHRGDLKADSPRMGDGVQEKLR